MCKASPHTAALNSDTCAKMLPLPYQTETPLRPWARTTHSSLVPVTVSRVTEAEPFWTYRRKGPSMIDLSLCLSDPRSFPLSYPFGSMKMVNISFSTFPFFSLIFLKLHLSIYLGGGKCHSAHVVVRRQLTWVSSSLCHVAPRSQTQVIRFGGQCLNPMSHLADLSVCFFS